MANLLTFHPLSNDLQHVNVYNGCDRCLKYIGTIRMETKTFTSSVAKSLSLAELKEIVTRLER